MTYWAAVWQSLTGETGIKVAQIITPVKLPSSLRESVKT
jgi:hypothetical protein